jgi:hypothetical protein
VHHDTALSYCIATVAEQSQSALDLAVDGTAALTKERETGAGIDEVNERCGGIQVRRRRYRGIP